MLILERSAVALAARRIQPDRIKNLGRINSELKKAWLEKKFLNVTLLNSQFHRSIYEAAENIFLISYLDNLQNQSQRLAYVCFSKGTSTYDLESHARKSIRDHQTLIELFSQGRDLEAVNLITEHVKLFQRRVNHFLLPSMDNIDQIPHLESLIST
jgi:DNA-binding GntR family transcriptional regulator